MATILASEFGSKRIISNEYEIGVVTNRRIEDKMYKFWNGFDLISRLNKVANQFPSYFHLLNVSVYLCKWHETNLPFSKFSK